MTAHKEPPDYPGDDPVNKGFVNAVRRIRIAKEHRAANAPFAEAIRRVAPSTTPRAIGVVVRELREKCSVLSPASELPVRLITQVERGKANLL